jgi:hypothetical protein
MKVARVTQLQQQQWQRLRWGPRHLADAAEKLLLPQQQQQQQQEKVAVLGPLRSHSYLPLDQRQQQHWAAAASLHPLLLLYLSHLHQPPQAAR